jgi:hypothetical protein
LLLFLQIEDALEKIISRAAFMCRNPYKASAITVLTKYDSNEDHHLQNRQGSKVCLSAMYKTLVPITVAVQSQV